MIDIIEPRWHDRKVLIADYKIEEHNLVSIRHKDFLTPIYLNGDIARTYPTEQMKTKKGSYLTMRVIPIDDLLKETINA